MIKFILGKSISPAILTTPLIAALISQSLATPAQACACCANPGDRATDEISLVGPENYLSAELKRIQISGDTNLYQTTCGLECVAGIDDPQDIYQTDLTHSINQWVLNFSMAGQSLGALSFNNPVSAETLSLDPTPDPTPNAQLYKEMTMPILVTGTGIFTGVNATPTPATFILQGTGNACTMATDFTHWQLDVSGANAKFKFFGKLAPPK